MGIRVVRSSSKSWAVAALTALAALFARAAEAEGTGALAVSMAHSMMMLLLQLGAILFAARLGNMLFTRLRLPGMLGELCAGVAIGPYALGRLTLPGFANGLFPEFFIRLSEGGHELRFVVSPELYGVCMLAAVVLLFLVGLETDLNLFLRYSVVGSLVGAGGVALSFLAGDLLSVWLLPWVVPGTYTALSPACVFLGVLSTATSVSITARILNENRRLDSPEGVTILAGAVFDDVLGIILLAVGMGVAGATAAQHTDWAGIGKTALGTLVVWLGATTAGVLAARTLAHALKRMGGHSEVAVLALGLALIMAGLFERAHLTMIIGSYVMGLSFSRTDINHMVREHLQPVFALLVPVFFAVMGMMVDLELLGDPKILLFGLVYTAACMLAKLAGCGLPTLLCGFNLRGALRVGVGMVPRGEVALVIAGVGLTSGFISKEVFGVAVLMTLLTTLTAPPLLIAAFNRKGSGLRPGKSPPGPLDVMLSSYSFPNEEVTALLRNSLMQHLGQEGYFAHALSMSEGIYQARKEDAVLNIRQSGNTIEIDAPPDAVPVVRLMMIEVIVEFEQTLKELRKPLGAELHTELSEVEAGRTVRRETLARHLSQEAMVPDLKATTKRAAIAELIDVLARAGLVKDSDAALASALKREAAMSTGLRHGIACPHARTDAVGRLVCAVGLKADGIEFQSMDAQPARVIILTLSPTTAESPYMAFMSSAMAVLHEEKALKLLLGCRTSGEMLRALVPDSRKK